jgi:gliding motility-associated-like protein
MKLFPSIIVPILLFAAPLAGFGQLYFVENKGQWDQQVHFKTEAGNSAFFLTKDGYSIKMNHPEDYLRLAEYTHGHAIDSNSKYSARTSPPDKMRAHAFRVKFLGGNFNSKPIMEKPLPGVENYFLGNDPSKWASDCRLYQAVTYKNVYPNIDVRYYVQDDLLKYDVVVYPGADVSKIQMRYEGAEKLSISNNELVVSTSVGEARELKPYTYQFVNGKRETVSNKYKITGNTVSFDVKAYNKSTTLIIDPSLVFSSFSRSTADNWGYTATYGADGSFFGGGTAQPSGFPVTPGAIQGSGGGGGGSGGAPPDIVIMKLSPDGRTRIYATYLGGSGLDQPHSLVADPAGNLVIAGRTNSGNSFPGTLVPPGTGGGYDIFVTKINATGTAIIGSLRIGGAGSDGVNITDSRNGANSLQRFYGDDGRSEVILDGAGNILVASSSQSSTDFPIINGFQGVSGGQQDAVILKLNPNATALIWSSFMGGSGQDAGFVLAINPLNPSNIYVGGGTTSPNFPGSGGGVVQPAYNGGLTDGYLAQLRDNGASVSMVRSTFLGTGNIDIVYGVQFDAMGFPYVMGTSTGNWPVINATYSVANSRQFIAKIRPDLSAFVYSTTFGTSGALNPNISPVAFLVDNCENVYVSGWGGGANNFGGGYPNQGTNGMPVTADAFQRNTDGSDFYFFVLQKNAASQLYGSFFGQLGGGGGFDHVDGGTSRFDANGTIYQALCANCKNVASGIPLQAPFPISAGVFGNTNPAGGSGCNLGMVKIAFDLSGIDVALRAVGARQLNFCLPATVQFTDTIAEANQYIWVWGDGTPNDTTTINPFTHTYTSTGFFDVKVIGIDSNSCNIKDSAFMRIRVTTDSVDLGFTFARQNCNTLNFQFTNTSNILTASTPFGPRSFVWVWGDGTPNDTVPGFAPPVSHTFPGIGSYNVRLVLIDSNYCNLGETEGIVDFQVIDFIRAGFSISNVCIPDTISVTDTSRGALTYLWVSSDGQTSTDRLPRFVYNSSGTFSITQYVYNPNSCNLVDSATRSFQAVAPPSAGFFFNPNPSQENTPTRFTSTSSEDAIQWLWDFGDGTTSTQRDPIHQYLAPGINLVCQTVTNQAGCVDSVCIPVESIINVVNDLPSAFTPNGDGVNDVFSVRGFGITKMTLRVYNRQGLMVFESRSQNIGWDGKYKGIPQPMDAYGWTLEVEYFTGEKFRKKGDVTLIR